MIGFDSAQLKMYMYTGYFKHWILFIWVLSDSWFAVSHVLLYVLFGILDITTEDMWDWVVDTVW